MYKVHQKLCLYLSSIVRTEFSSFWEESLKIGKAYIIGNVHSHEDECKLAFFKKNVIYALPHSHNAPYLPPKILHNLCFHFSWVLQSSQEKLKTVVMQNFGGQIRCMHYGKCGSPPLHISHTPCLASKDFP